LVILLVIYIFVLEFCITNNNNIMSVSFYLLRSNTERSSIMTTISYHGIVVKIASGLVCSPKNWDSLKYEVSRKENYWQDINRKLKELDSNIEKELQKMAINGIYPKLHNIKKLAINIRDKVVKGKDNSPLIDNSLAPSMMELFNTFIEKRKNSPDVRKNTIKNYITARKNLEEFAIKNKVELSFNSIDRQFYDDFTSFLSYEKNLQRSTTGFIIKTIKTFLNWSIDEEYNNNIKFIKALKIWREYPEKITLSEDEISLIENLNLSSDMDLGDSRNFFLIALYTGFRFSDVSNLKPEKFDMMNGRLKAVSVKTNQEIGAPIGRRLKNLLENNYPGLKIPKMDLGKLNTDIKIIAKIAGILKDEVKIIRRGNLRDELIIPRYELISSHTARHTYETRVEKLGLNSYAAMKAAGHQPSEVHARYVHFSLDEAIDALKGMWD
jgi:integrase